MYSYSGTRYSDEMSAAQLEQQNLVLQKKPDTNAYTHGPIHIHTHI